MIVFKATNNDMTCTMGQGTFQYQLGVPATAERSKCADSGLHACEYVLDCTGYYSLGRGNRFSKLRQREILQRTERIRVSHAPD